MSALTHGVSMRSRTLVHGGRRRLHPWRRQTIGIGGHGWASHIGHGRGEAVGTSVATRATMHAMEVPVLSWASAHPRWSVLLHTPKNKTWIIKMSVKQKSFYATEPQTCCQLTGGGWLLLGPDGRAPPWALECPPPDAGTGASPNSAIRDRYSLSIRALSWADWGGSLPAGLWAANVLHTQKTNKPNTQLCYQRYNFML